MHAQGNCPICKFPCREEISEKYTYDCLKCGKFFISKLAQNFFLNSYWSPQQNVNASGWIREHQGEFLNENDLRYLAKLETPSVAQKARKLLVWLAKQHPDLGSSFTVPFANIAAVLSQATRIFDKESKEAKESARKYLPWLTAAWAKNDVELKYLIFDFLTKEEKLLAADSAEGPYQFTPKGWATMEAAKSSPASDTAFVAMWFDNATNPLWTKAIEPGILDAGYQPFRIDKHEHNNRIDDEILASIRRSRFVVADFTGQRGGVYFEAGFGLGLGLPVVWLCKREEVDEKKVHFDTRQYNFVLWEELKWKELRKAITNRIVATIGMGLSTERTSDRID